MNGTILTGPHQGRTGKIVGSILGLWLTINVAANEDEIRQRYGDAYGEGVNDLIEEMKAGHGPREWVSAWRWNIRRSE